MYICYHIAVVTCIVDLFLPKSINQSINQSINITLAKLIKNKLFWKVQGYTISKKSALKLDIVS